MNFSFDKIIFSIFQVSRDRERCLTAFVRHFTLCGMLLERLFSCKSESITAPHVRHHSTQFSTISEQDFNQNVGEIATVFT